MLHSSLSEFIGDLTQREVSRLFVVTAQEAYSLSGVQSQFEKAIRQWPGELCFFNDFRPNPKFEDVLKGVNAFRAFKADGVLAIGGGTAMDLAKMIGNFSPSQSPIRSLIIDSHSLPPRSAYLGMIPTTSGTGSEATQFAVVYLEGKKFSVSHPNLLPDSILLAPQFTHSMPAGLTAASGLDAICQAIESMWSVRSTEDSRQWAKESLQLSLPQFGNAVKSPTPKNRKAMQDAAYLAGKAINVTRTTAPHALSYFLTSNHGLAHGFAVAMMMPLFLRFNSEAAETHLIDPRGVAHVQAVFAELRTLFQVESQDQLISKFEAMARQAGCPIRLTEIGAADGETRQQIANSVNIERLKNNPFRIDIEKIEALLATIS